jgi:hypothetical protein
MNQVLVKSKIHAFLLSCLFKAKSKFLHKSCGSWSLFSMSDCGTQWRRYKSHPAVRTIVYLWGSQSMKMSRLFSLLQEPSNQFPCGLCFSLRQSFQNVSKFLSNIPYMRGFTEYEQETLRTSAKYRIQIEFFLYRRISLAIIKIKWTEKEIFPTP